MKTRLPIRVQPAVMPLTGECGVYTNKIHYLRKYLLDELVSKKFAMDFMEPVDTVALQVPHYYAVIKHPMDVGTIIKRVQNQFYHCVEELIMDFRLVISNCYTFNRPGESVFRNCQKLEKFFQRVVAKMPRGEEKPSTKDPWAPGKLSFEKSSEVVQRQCREQMRKLHLSVAREEDKSICKYFNAKWDLLSQRVDKCCFKTVEEFRFELNNIFKKFDSQVKIFYEFYHRVCENGSCPTYDNCLMQKQCETIEETETRYILEDRDASNVLYTLSKAESAVEHCQSAYTREREEHARDLIEILSETVHTLKLKINNEYEEISECSADDGIVQNMDTDRIYPQQYYEEGSSAYEKSEDDNMHPVDQQQYDTQIKSYRSASPIWKKARLECSSSSKSYSTDAADTDSTLWSDLRVSSSDENEADDTD